MDKEFGAGKAKVSPISSGNHCRDGWFYNHRGRSKFGTMRDHMATIHSLSKHLNGTNDTKKLFFERGLFEVTEKLAARDYSLLSIDPETSIPVTVLSSEKPDLVPNLHRAKVTAMHGHNVGPTG